MRCSSRCVSLLVVHAIFRNSMPWAHSYVKTPIALCNSRQTSSDAMKIYRTNE